MSLLPATLAVTAVFGGDCSRMSVSEWSAEKTHLESMTRVTASVISALDRPTRMARGYVQFVDVLGRQIAVLPMPEDTALIPGEAASFSLPLMHADRLLTASPDNVVASACLTGVVFDDGTVKSFE